jgi:DNA processing protein
MARRWLNGTRPVSFAPNPLIKQGGKLASCWEDVIEPLSTPARAELLPVEAPAADERATLLASSPSGNASAIHALLSPDEPGHVDHLIEQSGLHSSEVLATLFDLEMKGIVRQLPGKQFVKVLF